MLNESNHRYNIHFQLYHKERIQWNDLYNNSNNQKIILYYNSITDKRSNIFLSQLTRKTNV